MSKIDSNLDPMKVAKYLFYRGHNMSNLTLQKLLFYAYKEYYLQTKKELFIDNFEACGYGPVSPEIYYKFGYILGDNDFIAVVEYLENETTVKNF